VTTIRVDHTWIGQTIALNGALSAIRFLVADRNRFRNVTIVDDAFPFDVVPKQIFNNDLLDAATNRNGTLQSPYGVLLMGGVAFGNLTIAACPPDAVFECDATRALAAADIEAVSARKALDRFAAGTVHAETLKAQAQQRQDDTLIRAEFIRTGRGLPPPPAFVEPPPPPPPPDPELIAAGTESCDAGRGRGRRPRNSEGADNSGAFTSGNRNRVAYWDHT
jgi:hypothetical protein